MLLSMKGRYTKQKGFSLLEALLAIVIIVAAGLGVVELFISADKKNKAQATEQVVQQTASAASQFLSTSYDSADVLSASNLIASGLISKNYVVGTGATATINSPYGTVDVASVSDAARDQYYVTLSALPSEQAMRICQDMVSSSAVYTGATTSGTLVKSLTACPTNFKDDASRVQMTFAFPKDAFSASE